MTLTTLGAALAARDDAAGARGALAAFNVVHIEHAEAYAAAAERARCPVVMQISESTVRFRGALRPLAEATLVIARWCVQPVVVQLDRVRDLAMIDEALSIGFSAVGFDGSALPPEQNQLLTQQVVERAAVRGASVQARLDGAVEGQVLGESMAGADRSDRTDPHWAAAFVEATGVDALAISARSWPAVQRRTARLDLGLVRDIALKVPVPLVLPGSSGLADDGLVAAAAAGIRKIDISTHVNRVFTHAVQDHLLREPTLDTQQFLGAAREAVTLEASRLIELIR